MRRGWLYVSTLLMTVSAGGCVELVPIIQYNLRPPDRFEYPCPGSGALSSFSEREVSFRAFDGPQRGRSEVAVLVLAPVSSYPCGTTRFLWTPALQAVDARKKALRLEPKTGRERREDLNLSSQGSPDCFRVALLPGAHVLALRLWSSGTTRTRIADIRGSTQFEAKAGGLYSIRACQQPEQKEPLFWIREETSGACVSITCPETNK